jgi:hypothetical protein
VGKHADAVKSYDEFRAPWETEAGTDAEIDKPKLKRYIYNLVTDKAKAQDARDDKDEALTQATADLEAAKTEAANANGPEAQKKIDALQATVDKLTGEAKARKEADEHEALRKEVIGDLDPKYAKYVVGADREALEKSLEDVKADFGIEDGDGDGDEDGDEDEPTVRTTPRSRVRNPADPQNGKAGEAPIDFEAVADEYLGNSVFR